MGRTKNVFSVFGLFLALIWMVVVPIGFRWRFLSFKGLPHNVLLRAHWVGLLLFSTHLVLMIFSMWWAYSAVRYFVAPIFLGYNPDTLKMNDPLEVGSFLYLLFAFGFPYLVFRHAGLVGVRDFQQCSKEIRDRLSKF